MAARASAATCRPTKIVLPCPARADCVSGPGGGSVSAGREDQLAEALDSARIAHQVACPEARRRVLDHVPQGAPDLAELTGEQRRVVQRWQAAEAAYDRLLRPRTCRPSASPTPIKISSAVMRAACRPSGHAETDPRQGRRRTPILPGCRPAARGSLPTGRQVA